MSNKPRASCAISQLPPINPTRTRGSTESDIRVRDHNFIFPATNNTSKPLYFCLHFFRRKIHFNIFNISYDAIIDLNESILTVFENDLYNFIPVTGETCLTV